MAALAASAGAVMACGLLRLRRQLQEAVATEDGPTVLRFPKAAVGSDIEAVDRIGGLDVLRRSEDGDVLIVCIGALASICLDVADRVAAQGLGVTVVDPGWVLPVDASLPALAASHSLVVTVEDNVVAGGVGSAISRELRARGIDVPVREVVVAAPLRTAG